MNFSSVAGEKRDCYRLGVARGVMYIVRIILRLEAQRYEKRGTADMQVDTVRENILMS